VTGSTTQPHDIALPRSFDARYAEGQDRGLSLGGGGLFFIAWQVAYLRGLIAEGVDVGAADRVVATSAGSVVGTGLLAGRLDRMYTEISWLVKAPALVALLAKSADLTPSQQRAWDLFEAAEDERPETIQAIGHAALAARARPSAGMRRTLGLIVGAWAWPSERLHVTCVDVYTGERCVITQDTGVHATAAMAASTALPGIYSPQRIGERLCMDGGVSGSALHLDVLAGSRRALVLSLLDDSDGEPGMTFTPGGTQREIEALTAGGTQVELRMPEAFELDELMSPAALPKALKMGARQAAADAPGLRGFWA
jgi:NTE family protein